MPEKNLMYLIRCPKCGVWTHLRARAVVMLDLELRHGARDRKGVAPPGVRITSSEIPPFTIEDLFDVQCTCGEPVEIEMAYAGAWDRGKDKVMAKPKWLVKVELCSHGLVVWADNLSVKKIMSIEGVLRVYSPSVLPWIVLIDARYDGAEVAAEVEEMLLADVFKKE